MHVHELPPGGFRREHQWLCECPFSGCGEHFEWNTEHNVGWCFVCNKFCQNLEQLRLAFAGKLGMVEARIKTVRHKVIDPLGRCNAWDHSKSRLWCQQKNFLELGVREVDMEYNPEVDELYIQAESISRGQPKTTLYRPMHGNPKRQKWLHLGGTKAAYYGWNISKFKGSGRKALICEGLSDLLATRMYPYGIVALGSSLNSSWFYWMSKNIRKAYFWFDADAAGEKAYKACEEMARHYGLPYKSLRTPKDPKFFAPQVPSDREYLEKLEKILCE